MLIKILIFISLSFFSIGTYVIWFSRWNVIAHLQLGFIFAGYFVPLFLTDSMNNISNQLLIQYSFILSIGALTFLIGLIIGNKLPLLKITNNVYSFNYLKDDELYYYVAKRVKLFLVIAILGIIVSYCVMGFIPMFAQDPMSAKFFKGQYQGPYNRVAIIYRFSYFIIITLLCLTFSLWIYKKNKTFLLLGILGTILIFISLTRQPALYGILTFLGLYFARKRNFLFYFYLISIFVIYSVGSSIYYILGKVLKFNVFGSFYNDQMNIWSVIASGSPDILDQLTFLSSFNSFNTFSYGKTFFGGLVPGNYYWNPSVWTLAIVNRTSDISNIASGGYRLPIALHGYMSFGWIGVLLVPFLSGLVYGSFINFIKSKISSTNILINSLLILFYSSVASFIGDFYKLSMYSLPVLCVTFLLINMVYVGNNKNNLAY